MNQYIVAIVQCREPLSARISVIKNQSQKRREKKTPAADETEFTNVDDHRTGIYPLPSIDSRDIRRLQFSLLPANSAPVRSGSQSCRILRKGMTVGLELCRAHYQLSAAQYPAE